MPTNRSVIDALLAAIENDKGNSSLRLHVASPLAEDKLFAEAMEHIQNCLNQDPTNLDALKQAADVAEKLGDLAKAASYRKLLDALIGVAEKPNRLTAGPSKDDWPGFISEEPENLRTLGDNFGGIM